MKRIFSLGLILILLLTACGNRGSEAEATVTEPAEEVAQATPTEVTEESQPEATPTEVPSTVTPTQPAAAETNIAEEESAAPVGEAACRLESIQELLPLEPLPGIASVSADDWQHGGGQEARVQIIEYGDFQ